MTGTFPARASLGARASLLTYEPYFGLKEKPFSLSVDPRFLYKSATHAPVFDDLLAGIRRREGLIVLTGDIGTGKTTLCRAVLEALDRKTFSAFVPDPFVSREDLLKMLLVDFGVMSVDDLKSGRLKGASRPDLSYPLYEFLNSLVPLQAFAVLIIDEAQNLPVPLLEEIRILSDLEAPEKLLQVVLVGQLELQTKLKLPEMRQVDQRVSVRCRLEALSRDRVAGYVAHRLLVAGGSPDRVAFTPPAIDLIWQKSAGVPRVINLICDRALHRAHLARKPVVDADLALLAMVDLGIADAERDATTASVVEAAGAHAPVPARDRKSEAEPDEEIVFDEHDLVHAAQAMLLDAQRAAEPIKDGASPPAYKAGTDQPLLFEAHGTWTAQTPTVRGRWRRRTRRLMLAAVAAAVVAFASYWQSQWDADLQTLAAPSGPESPYPEYVTRFEPKRVPARVPMAPATDQTTAPALFAVDVALFSGPDRASRLVEQLTAAGFSAYVKDLNLGDRGHLYEVVAGPFSTRSEADEAVSRIQAIPGYGDARVVSSTP